jgi:hypothetical protein
MKVQWTTAALLGSVLIAGCGGGQKAQETKETPANTPVTATESSAAPAAPAVSPSADTAATSPAKPAPKAKPAAKTAPAKTAASAPAAASGPSTPEPAAPAASAPAAAAPVAEAAPAPPPAPKIEYRTVRIPANTSLALELMTPLSSETTTVETPVKARLKQAVNADGLTILPAGTILNGAVTEVEQSGRVKGRAKIAFAFTTATVAGAKEKLHTAPLVFEAEQTKGKDATKIGVGAGVGAVLGGILGGGSGAAKGAAIGGGVGTGAVLATKGDEVTLAEGKELQTTLADPFELKVRVE